MNKNQPIQNLLHNPTNHNRQIIIPLRLSVTIQSQTRRPQTTNILVKVDVAVLQVAVLQVDEVDPRMRPETPVSQNLDDILGLLGVRGRGLQTHHHAHFVRDFGFCGAAVLADAPEYFPRETLLLSLPLTRRDQTLAHLSCNYRELDSSDIGVEWVEGVRSRLSRSRPLWIE